MALRIKIDDVPDNIIFFDSDDEFTDFCLLPYAVIKKNSLGENYYIGVYSGAYLKAIEEEKYFVIKDKDSVIFKRKCVAKRVTIKQEGGTSTDATVLVQMPVENLDEYDD